MSAQKKHIYDIEARRYGETVVFSVYRAGRALYIDDHLVHPSNRSERGLQAELRIVFDAELVRKVRPEIYRK